MKFFYHIFLIFIAVCFSVSVSATHTDEATIAKRTAPVGQVYREGDEIQPSGKVVVAEEPAVAAIRSGEAIYTSKCAMCHATGAANAPILADVAAWQPRIAKGMETLIASAVNGTAAGMPPKGMCMDCSDDELKSTVEYMVEHSK